MKNGGFMFSLVLNVFQTQIPPGLGSAPVQVWAYKIRVKFEIPDLQW